MVTGPIAMAPPVREGSVSQPLPVVFVQEIATVPLFTRNLPVLEIGTPTVVLLPRSATLDILQGARPTHIEKLVDGMRFRKSSLAQIARMARPSLLRTDMVDGNLPTAAAALPEAIAELDALGLPPITRIIPRLTRLLVENGWTATQQAFGLGSPSLLSAVLLQNLGATARILLRPALGRNVSSRLEIPVPLLLLIAEQHTRPPNLILHASGIRHKAPLPLGAFLRYLILRQHDPLSSTTPEIPVKSIGPPIAIPPIVIGLLFDNLSAP